MRLVILPLVALALSAPAGAAAASWTDSTRPVASWTDSNPTASWTDSRPHASWTDRAGRLLRGARATH